MIKNGKISIKKDGLKVIWIVFVLLSVFVWGTLVDQLVCQEYPNTSQYVFLNDGWDVQINDVSYHDVSLNDFEFEAVDKGDKIVMQKELPNDWGIEQGALRLHIRQTAVKMYIDDEQVYEYGCDRMLKNKTVGSGFQFIDFPEEYGGKNLKIELHVTENHAFTSFDSIQICKWENAYRALFTENRLPMFLGSFLIIFGISTALITMFALLSSRKYVRLFCISLFSVYMGLWTLCYYNTMLIFSVPLHAISLLEYLALYMAPVPIIIYMHENVKNLKNKYFEGIYWGLFAVQLIFDTVTILLHTMDIVHFAATLKYLQVLIILYLIYFSIVLLLNLKNSQSANRLYLIGMLIIAGTIGYDMVGYYRNRFSGGRSLPLKGVSSIGIMVFIFILFFAFYMNLTEKMMQEKERDFLIKSAYMDELTKLNNRRYCAEYMKEVDEDPSYEYAVISFDLNNLKTVNDTYGHSQGDLLIKNAAEVISKTFKDRGVVGRMGGDEFIVILKTSRKEEVEQLLERFRLNVSRKNKETDDFELSIACGYALSNEAQERNIEKIYQLADDRMYENKKESKKVLDI